MYPWLEYSQQKDAAFCFYCRLFKTRGCYGDPTFVQTGFRDWKHACGRKGALACHASSHAHKTCMLNSEQFKLNIARGCTIGERLDSEGKRVISKNHHYVRSLAEVILLCAQQGLALRGHGDSMDDASKNPGNFKVLVNLLSKHDDVVRKRLVDGPRNATFLGHAIQNELIEVMAGKVIKKIQNELNQASYYTIIADETKDISKKEQLSIIVRYVYSGLVHERFIKYVHATELDAASLTENILQIISQMQLSIDRCVSQCYDGASVMSGACSGVSARIKELNPRAVYIHCCAHRLNLALVDTVKSIPVAEDFFALLQTLYVFISASKAHEIFLSKQTELGQKQEIRLKRLCETRWACRHTSINAIASTIEAILATLNHIIEGNDREKAVEANGLYLQVNCFQFLLCLYTFQKLFSITAKLSDVLQAEKLDFAGAAGYIEATVGTLKGLRSSDEWKKMWEDVTTKAASLQITVESPRSTRNRRLPARLQGVILTSETLGNRSLPVEQYCTQLYFATIDIMVGEIEKRFDSVNLSLMKAMQALTPKSTKFLDYDTLLPFLSHYHVLQVEEVRTELLTAKQMLASNGSLKTLHDVYDQLDTVPQGFPQLMDCLKIAMTFGVTSASAERSFSSLKHVKTYLRSTMTQERLNNLALLYIERELSTTLWESMDDIILTFAQKHKNSRILLL